MVCWSVIAMLKQYFFLALSLSALAVLAALTLHEKCCTTGKPKDLESNQEEDIQPEGQPLIESEEVKFKLPTGEGSTQTGRKQLLEGSKDNEGVPEHEKDKRSQAGGVEKGLDDDKLIKEQEEEQVKLEPTAGERGDQAEASTERKPRTEEMESKGNEGLPENIKVGTSQKVEIQVEEEGLEKGLEDERQSEEGQAVTQREK